MNKNQGSQKDQSITDKGDEVPAWTKGIANSKRIQERGKYEETVSSQPFARYDYDQEYDMKLRNAERYEDPMKQKNECSGDSTKPICPFQAPENRFGLKPGYRWDGIVRGNGYEEAWLTARDIMKAKNEVEDYELDD